MTHYKQGNESCNTCNWQKVSGICRELPQVVGERQLTPTGKKWVKKIGFCRSQEFQEFKCSGSQMASKLMERCSAQLAIRKCKLDPQEVPFHTSEGWTLKSPIAKCWQGCVAAGTFKGCWRECNSIPHWMTECYIFAASFPTPFHSFSSCSPSSFSLS